MNSNSTLYAGQPDGIISIKIDYKPGAFAEMTVVKKDGNRVVQCFQPDKPLLEQAAHPDKDLLITNDEYQV